MALLADWSTAVPLPLALIFMAHFRIHAAELLPESTADAAIRDQMQADFVALDGLGEKERNSPDECLAEYPLEDSVARDEADLSSSSTFERWITPRTSLEFSGGLRRYTLRRAINPTPEAQIDPAAPEAVDIALRQIGVPLMTRVLSVAAGFGIAVVGQRLTTWKLWIAAALVVFVADGARRSWQSAFRARRINLKPRSPMSSLGSRKLRETRQYHLTQAVITIGSNSRLRNSGDRHDLIKPTYQIANATLPWNLPANTFQTY
jgi:hypothetical protein